MNYSIKRLLNIARVGIIALAIALMIFWDINILEPNQERVFPNPKSETLTILAVGDIMLSRDVARRVARAGDPNLPFRNVFEILSSADIAFGNLECPLDDRGDRMIGEGLVFNCLVEDSVGLTAAGFDVLSTANNHSMDQDTEYLEFTVEHLLSKSILPVGTGRTFFEVHNGRIVEVDGIKLGFLAYSYSAFNDGGGSTNAQIATLDKEQAKIDIAKLNPKTDYVFVSMHAGEEYEREPNEQQIEFAQGAIDAGADAVIGHHPHWIQPIEIYKGKPIFYSLGNFVFDQMWSQDTREGLAIKLLIEESKIESVELIPVVIDNYCCPRLANEQEKVLILKKIGLDNNIVKF